MSAFLWFACGVVLVPVIAAALYLRYRSWEPATAVDEERQLMNARHEAGHAVVQALSFGPETVCELCTKTFVHGNEALYGYMKSIRMPEGRSGMWTMDTVRRQVDVLLGGRAADELLNECPHAGASSDLERATDLLVTAFACWGLGDTLVVYKNDLLTPPDELVGWVDHELKHGRDRAKAIVARNRAVVERLAAALMDKVPSGGERVLDAGDLEKFFEEHPVAAPDDDE